MYLSLTCKKPCYVAIIETIEILICPGQKNYVVVFKSHIVMIPFSWLVKVQLAHNLYDCVFLNVSIQHIYDCVYDFLAICKAASYQPAAVQWTLPAVCSILQWRQC